MAIFPKQNLRKTGKAEGGADKLQHSFKIRFSRLFWILLVLTVAIFTGTIVVRNLFHTLEVNHKVRLLEEEKESLEAKISADSLLMEQLKDDDYLEEYARNRFRMHRAGEEVYVFEKE